MSLKIPPNEGPVPIKDQMFTWMNDTNGDDNYVAWVGNRDRYITFLPPCLLCRYVHLFLVVVLLSSRKEREKKRIPGRPDVSFSSSCSSD